VYRKKKGNGERRAAVRKKPGAGQSTQLRVHRLRRSDFVRL